MPPDELKATPRPLADKLRLALLINGIDLGGWMGGLVSARFYFDRDDLKSAKAQLQWVLERSSSEDFRELAAEAGFAGKKAWTDRQARAIRASFRDQHGSNGMGKLIYDSIMGNDFNLALVGLLFATLLTLVSNLAADVIGAGPAPANTLPPWPTPS